MNDGAATSHFECLAVFALPTCLDKIQTCNIFSKLNDLKLLALFVCVLRLSLLFKLITPLDWLNWYWHILDVLDVELIK